LKIGKYDRGLIHAQSAYKHRLSLLLFD